jgi:hypothetical protein
MHVFFPLASAQHAPYFASQVWWNPIEQRFPDSFSAHDLERIEGIVLAVYLQERAPFLVVDAAHVWVAKLKPLG